MGNGEQSSKEDTDSANDHVGDAHKRISAADDSSRRDENCFRTAVLSDGEI